jgi:hypothetical protein
MAGLRQLRSTPFFEIAVKVLFHHRSRSHGIDLWRDGEGMYHHDLALRDCKACLISAFFRHQFNNPGIGVVRIFFRDTNRAPMTAISEDVLFPGVDMKVTFTGDLPSESAIDGSCRNPMKLSCSKREMRDRAVFAPLYSSKRSRTLF